MTANPYVGRVVDLVNPYMTPDKNQTGGYAAGGTEYTKWWLNRHPGRWALVGEAELGMSKHVAERLGFEYGIRNKRGEVCRTYARKPHPRGEDLMTALRRHEIDEVSLDLPELVRSPFKWTVEELAEAAAVARANLFPVADKERS